MSIKNIPKDVVFGAKKLIDGRWIIPKSYVEERAFLNPQGSPEESWLAAEKWFDQEGYNWVDEEEWCSYSERKKKVGSDELFFVKKK